MGSKRQPRPVPVPSPERIAQTDADFNRIDQITPFGNLTFGGPRRNQATLELTPELQNLFDLQTQSDTNLLNTAIGAEQGINELVGNPLSTQGLPGLEFDVGGGPSFGRVGDPNAFRDDVTNAFFDRSSGLLNRQFDRNEDRLRQTLANQGIQTDSGAGSQELGDFNIQRNESFGRLANDAVLFGGQEASRAFGDQLAGTGFNNAASQQEFGNLAFGQDRQNAARSQLFNESAALRGSQFNELASLLGLQQTQTPGLQNFFGPSQVGVGDAFALNQAGLQNNFNNQSRAASQAKGGTAGLIGNLGGAAITGGLFGGGGKGR